MMNDFVWPSDRDRAENDELNRVCEYAEQLLGALEAARAQGDAEKEAEKEESKGDFPLKEESLIRKAARAQGDAEPVAYISHTSESSCLDWFAQFDAPRHTPLYTHPPKAQAVPESIEAAIDMLEDYASALENGDLDGAGHSTTACIHEVIDQLTTAPQPPQEGLGDA
ncbi:MAG: hypothetical protein L0J77_14840 [Marinobacter sp.]|nr:hypothetical protein [Marinobacter sp.]